MEGAMRQGHYTLKGKDVQEHAANLLQRFLRLVDHGPKCTVQVVLHVLFYAASRVVSIYAACQRLCDAPCDSAMFAALVAMMPEYAELQRRVNRTLAADVPKAMRRRLQRLAIDLTLIPYHGEPLADPKEVYRGLAKSGTSHFHAYASLYVVCQGQRFTIALTPVEKGEAMGDVVKRLLRQAARVGVRPRLLLLDRGFYSIEVIRYLQCARVPFLMPAVARGRKRKNGEVSGIRAFRTWKKGGWGKHTLTASKGRYRRATVSVCVYCGNYRGQWKRHGRFAWVYVYWGFRPCSPRWVADTYRTRFGIESSYRQMNQARIRTCTRDPMLRFLFVAIALILRNVWVWYHWEVLARPRRGRRLLCLERLRLDTLLTWLLHVAEDALGVRDETTTERPPDPPVRTAMASGP